MLTEDSPSRRAPRRQTERPLSDPGPVTIAFLSSCVRGGGAGWSLYYLVKHLDRRRISPVVLLPTPGIFGDLYRDIGVPVRVVPRLPERTAQQLFKRDGQVTAAASTAINLARSGLAVREVAQIAQECRAQLIYCNNMMVKPIGALAATRAGIPAFLHVRNLHEQRLKILLYCKLIARLPAVHRIVSNSAASAVPYLAAAPEKVRVVHNGVDLADYEPDKVPRGTWRAEHGIAATDVVVGYTGNLIERKGLLELIEAAGTLAQGRGEASPRTVFAAVGRVPLGQSRAYMDRCVARVAELGLERRFLFTGFVRDVRPALVDFDVLTLPSLQEPFGRSIVEAMALRVPVVASRVGGIPEIIDDEISGLLCAPGEPALLARAIGRLVDDPALRKRIGDAGRRKVEDAFDVAKLTREMESLLLQAAS